jgi:hypothetical protein
MALKARRMDESRAKLARAFAFALGGYMEQEATKEDQWRDQSIGQLYAHLRHELDEIQSNLRQSDMTWLVHNASDAVGLATIFLAKVLEAAGVESHDTDGSTD